MMNFSKFGAKLTAKTGILELMEDLGRAMNQQGTVYMLGGGNPSHIPVVEKILRGEFADGTRKKILLPLCPEYIGYADQGLTSDFFVSFRPTVEYLGAHTF